MTDPEKQGPPPAVLVGVQLQGVTDEQHIADIRELGRLATTLGLQVLGAVTQRMPRLSPGTVLGEGKLLELAAWTGGSGEIKALLPSQALALRRKEYLQQRDRPDDSDDDDVALTPDEPSVRARPALFVVTQGAGAPGEAHETVSHRGTGAPNDNRDDLQELDFDREQDDDFELPFAEFVIVNHKLTPRMHRNLERATGATVLDRTHLIVEIFHRHAQSREARLQVEIARLTYVAPRLRESGGAADRQRGGVGGKGAGESALELDRRKIRDRISKLRDELAHIDRTQGVRRTARQDQRRVALVGYTNAGKSSLMQALTASGVYVADKLFATLDTTVRVLQPETHPRILVSDTVGFIKDLPHELVASFRSTLDEAREASLLLYVVDASDPTFRDQLEVARQVLAEIGADSVPSRLLLNKRDRLGIRQIYDLAQEFPESICISAHNPDDVARVRDLAISFFDGEMAETELFVPYAAHGLVARIYEDASVLGERHDELGTYFAVRAPKIALARLRKRLDMPAPPA